MGGILGQVVNRQVNMEDIVATAVWWHSQAGILAAKERTELGVDAFTLTQYLSRVLAQTQTDEICMG
jgi:NAD(P)H-hydrate epimerase